VAAARTAPRALDRLGLLAAVVMLAGPGMAWGRLVPAMVGFGLFVLGGLTALVVVVLGVVRTVRGRGLGSGVVVAMVAAGVFMLIAARGGGVPAINDFTTDLADPPAFRHARTLRVNAGRDLDYPTAFADLQRLCCPDLLPVRLLVPPTDALARAREVAERMPSWTVTHADPDGGTIEAVATTRVFGFEDDVVIRVRSQPDGSTRVDMRSKSRDGRGDIGANAARIRAFMAALTPGG
jgi:uncharacterized protein (DUF1499 family)